MPCSSCYEIVLQSCSDELLLKAGLAANTEYYYLITDKFDNVRQRQVRSDSDGTLHIDLKGLGSATFNPHAGFFNLGLRNGDNYLTTVTMTFGGKTYGCVQMKFENIDADPENPYNVIQ